MKNIAVPEPKRGKQSKCVPFPAKARLFLGKWSDARIHHQFGVSLPMVQRERELRNIPPTRRKRLIHWTPAMIRQLHDLDMSNSDLGDRFGVGASPVGYKRVELGLRGNSISDHKLRTIKIDLTRLSNHAVARKNKISGNYAGALRRMFKIPVFVAYHKIIKWTRKMIRELGMIPDPEFSRKYGVSRPSIDRKRQSLGIPAFNGTSNPIHWTKTMLNQLGTMLDKNFAKLYRVGYATVVTKRHALKIPSVRGKPPGKISKSIRHHRWSPEMRKLLGTAQDADLAQRFGVTSLAVKSQRYLLRIPAFPN
jgi:hypothetical protein